MTWMPPRKMSLVAAPLCGVPSIATRTFRRPASANFIHLPRNCNHGTLFVPNDRRKGNCDSLVVRSMLNKLKSNLSDDDNRTTEPTRILLERLFAKTQKLEEMMGRESSFSDDAELSMNLENLESDLQAVLSSLRTKEAEIRNAEKIVSQKQMILNQTKYDLEQREMDIANAFSSQKKMEEDLDKANSQLASQSRQLEDLRILVKKQASEIMNLQTLLSLKEHQLDDLRSGLMNKTEEAETLRLQFRSKQEIIEQADTIIKEQETNISNLESEIEENQIDLANLFTLRQAEHKRLKSEEDELGKRTMEWLVKRDELKELTEKGSNNISDLDEVSEDLKRVRALLAAVRSELISSQESLASSRRKLENDTLQFEKQSTELDRQRLLLISYCENLEVAQLEFDKEKEKFGAVHMRWEELETQLLTERKRIEYLEEELTRERTFVQHKMQEIEFLQNEIRRKQAEYSNTGELLQVKESELIEAKLQIQHMKSEITSIQDQLEEKDDDLLSAQRELAKANIDIDELQKLMSSKEDQLVQATTRLQEKEKQIQDMSHDLADRKFKASEAASVVQRIVQLTNRLVVSAKDEGRSGIDSFPGIGSLLYDIEQDAGTNKQQELEYKLVMLKESLGKKEKELLSAQRAMAAKDEELKAVLERWEIREKELENTKEDLLGDDNGLKKRYNLVQQRVGCTRDLKIQNLKCEASQVEAEAASSALRKLAEITHQLLKIDDKSMISGTRATGVDLSRKSEILQVAEKEVSHLFTLTLQLLEEAGIADAELQQ